MLTLGEKNEILFVLPSIFRKSDDKSSKLLHLGNKKEWDSFCIALDF